MKLVTWFILAILTLTGAGCVLVDTPSVRVGAIGAPAGQSLEPQNPSPPYASTLKKTIDQQAKVLKELNERKWDSLLDESGDWLEHIRKLSGYAGSSSDPNAFQDYCGRLTREVQALRKAALVRDVEGCKKSILACDPILDEFCRKFPLTGTPPPPAEPSANPVVRANRIP